MPVGSGFDLPPGVESQEDFHWFKVSPGRSLLLVVLSEAPVWYSGHYVDSRMWPCLGDGCGFCEQGIGIQIRFVFGVAEISTRKQGMLEVGKSHGLQLRDWMQSRGELRGMMIELQKEGKARQSRTDIQLVDREPPVWYLAFRGANIKRALALTWRKAEMPIPRQISESLSLEDQPSVR